jgi:hypothetical protein
VSKPSWFSVTGSSLNRVIGSSFKQVCISLIQVLNNAFAVNVFTRLPMTNQIECAVDAPNLRTLYTTSVSLHKTGASKLRMSSAEYPGRRRR